MRDLNVMINPRLISKQCEGPEHVNRPGNSLGLRLLGVNSRKGGGTQLLCSAPRAQSVWCGQASDVCRLRCLSLLCGACVHVLVQHHVMSGAVLAALPLILKKT